MLNLPFKFYIGEDQRFLLEVVLISVLAGIFLTLFLQYLFFKLRFGVLPVLSPPTKEQFPKIKLPKVLIEEATKSSLNITENCLWFNLLTQFLFRELRDTQRIRRWVMKKMNKEFQELLSTLSGKIMDQIIVRHFNLGNNFPVFKSVSIKNVIIHEDVIEELDLCLDVNYTGGFQLAVDVFLLFNKSAYLSVTMNKLMGKARMQFSRMPFTHWSFSFYEDPEIDFAVESHFDGRPVPQIATLIISQIRRSIRKKHTLPNFKMRFQPFFSKPEPYVPQRELKVAGQSISVGQLRVTVVECSRLPRTPKEALLYCNVSIDTLPWNELIGIQQRIWKTLEIEVTKEQGQNVGLTFKEEHLLDRLEVVVLVDSVTPGTPAVLADIRKNDILLAVGTTKVSSSKHAAKLIRNAGEKFTLRIDRADSKHYKYYEDTISSKDSVMMSEMGDETQSEYADDEFVNISIKGGDQMSLRSATASETKSVKLPDSYMRMPRAAADDSDGESSNHISLRKKGRSESVPCLTIPEEIQIESEYVSDSDEDLFNNVQRIPEVQASQRPCWNKQVVFDVTEQYRYLNVCVRCKVPEKVDKSDRVVKHQRDLLLGHASLPLSDIALQCLLTRQGDSRQTMPLQQGEIKISASHVKSRRPAQMQQLYYGDITLAYHFQPVNMSEKERLKLTRDVIHNTIYETSSRDSSPDNRFSEKAQMPETDLHHFTGTQFHSATYCHFCGKKIWMKVAFQCSNCTMICHKKCVDKCNSDTICTEKGPMKRSEPSEMWEIPVSTKKKVTLEDREVTSRTGRLLSKFRKEPTSVSKPDSLKAGKSLGGSPTRKSDDQSSTPNLSPRPSPRPSPQPPRKFPSLIPDPSSVLAEAMGTADLNSCESSDDTDIMKMIQDQQEKVKGQNLDELVVTSAKQMGRELFAHLDVEDRKQKLDSLVLRLQQEIDQETENKNYLCLALDTETDSEKRQILENKLNKSDEKTEALMMLLLHYCAGLQHCLDLEEELRQKSDMPGETTGCEEAAAGTDDAISEETAANENELSSKDDELYSKDDDVGDAESSEI